MQKGIFLGAIWAACFSGRRFSATEAWSSGRPKNVRPIEPNYLIQVVARPYDQASIILTSNKSFTEWGEVLGDTVLVGTIIGRLLNRAPVLTINGPNCHMKDPPAMREHLRRRGLHVPANVSLAGRHSTTVEGDSWLVPHGKAEIFQESNPGSHRHFVDTWVRRDGGDAYAPVRYDGIEAETLPSAYATLVDFVVALSTGAEARARDLVADPALLDEARRLGLVQLPPGQRWMLDLPDPAVETAGPLTILDGPAAGVTVSFVRRGEAWLIAGFSR